MRESYISAFFRVSNLEKWPFHFLRSDLFFVDTRIMGETSDNRPKSRFSYTSILFSESCNSDIFLDTQNIFVGEFDQNKIDYFKSIDDNIVFSIGINLIKKEIDVVISNKMVRFLNDIGANIDIELFDMR